MGLEFIRVLLRSVVLLLLSAIKSVLTTGDHTDSVLPECTGFCAGLRASEWPVHDSSDCLHPYSSSFFPFNSSKCNATCQGRRS